MCSSGSYAEAVAQIFIYLLRVFSHFYYYYSRCAGRRQLLSAITRAHDLLSRSPIETKTRFLRGSQNLKLPHLERCSRFHFHDLGRPRWLGVLFVCLLSSVQFLPGDLPSVGTSGMGSWTHQQIFETRRRKSLSNSQKIIKELTIFSWNSFRSSSLPP